jgi:predicted flavoprotein YhiN
MNKKIDYYNILTQTIIIIMHNNMERNNMLAEYLNAYTPENRIGFVNLVLHKYPIEKYGFKKCHVDDANMIVQDKNIRNLATKIINSNKCSIDEFKTIFNMLTLEQINYIGF